MNVSLSKATINVSSFAINAKYLQNGSVYVNPATGQNIHWGVELIRTTLQDLSYEDGTCTITLVMNTNLGYRDISVPKKLTESDWKSSGDNVSRGTTVINQTSLIPALNAYGRLYLKINRYNKDNKVWEDVYSGFSYPITTVVTVALPESMKKFVLINDVLPAMPSTKFYPSSTVPILTVGQNVYSPNRQYYLTLQTDGNLVLYRADGLAVWYSNTNNTSPVPAQSLFFQTDGNLVLYVGFGDNPNSTWSSKRYATNGETLGDNAYYALEDNGNLVLYFTYPGLSPGVTMAYVLAYSGSNGHVSPFPGRLAP
ncbi:hypothetical protein [Pedobacter sp. NJ-S-72]